MLLKQTLENDDVIRSAACNLDFYITSKGLITGHVIVVSVHNTKVDNVVRM